MTRAQDRLPRPLSLGPLAVRAGQAVAIASIGAFAILALLQVRDGWWMQDADAYWHAALRLREGAPLYPALTSQDASDVYRYAPWFAAAWVPLTLLPQSLAYVAWGGVLFAAAGSCIWQMLRIGGMASGLIAVLTAALLLPAAASGNVQPLLLATLLFGLERRSGPLWIALAASLKAAPILLAAVYLGRREWSRAILTLGLTAILTLPMLLFDLSHYPTDTAAATGPLPFWLLLAAAACATVASIPLARTRYAWLAAAAAVLLAIPRWSYYQPSFLILGLSKTEREDARS
jgi:hypothetical protein